MKNIIQFIDSLSIKSIRYKEAFDNLKQDLKKHLHAYHESKPGIVSFDTQQASPALGGSPSVMSNRARALSSVSRSTSPLFFSINSTGSDHNLFSLDLQQYEASQLDNYFFLFFRISLFAAQKKDAFLTTETNQILITIANEIISSAGGAKLRLLCYSAEIMAKADQNLSKEELDNYLTLFYKQKFPQISKPIGDETPAIIRMYATAYTNKAIKKYLGSIKESDVEHQHVRSNLILVAGGMDWKMLDEEAASPAVLSPKVNFSF